MKQNFWNGCFFFAGREHAQQERKRKLEGEASPALAALDLRCWDSDSILDLAFPCAACVVLAGAVICATAL